MFSRFLPKQDSNTSFKRLVCTARRRLGAAVVDDAPGDLERRELAALAAVPPDRALPGFLAEDMLHVSIVGNRYW
jgi:hypothetical protein